MGQVITRWPPPATAGLPAPRVTLVRSLTVENMDSIGFAVRKWTQCPAGRS